MADEDTPWRYQPTMFTDAMWHKIRFHPAREWEYRTTAGPLDDWPGRETPPDGAGWVLNVEAGDAGHERMERHEWTHWRRRTP